MFASETGRPNYLLLGGNDVERIDAAGAHVRTGATAIAFGLSLDSNPEAYKSANVESIIAAIFQAAIQLSPLPKGKEVALVTAVMSCGTNAEGLGFMKMPGGGCAYYAKRPARPVEIFQVIGQVSETSQQPAYTKDIGIASATGVIRLPADSVIRFRSK